MKETNFKSSPLGQIPHDWDIVKLDDIASLFGRIGFRGYNTSDLVPKGQGAITLSPSNMKDCAMDYSKCTYISWEKYEESPEIKIFDDDILMVKTGSTYGKVALVRSLPSAATINPQLVVFKKLKCDSKFLASLLSRGAFQSQIETITSGGAIPTMSQAKILELNVALPIKSEQERISKVLSDIDKLIDTTEELLQKKRDIKQGTMQVLLTGKRRLPGFSKPWNKVDFRDIYKNASEGGTPNTNITSYYLNGDIPFAKIEDTSSKYIDHCNTHITASGLSNSSAWLIPPQSIILTNGATIGNVAINRIPITTKQGILGIVIKSNFDVEFLYYLLSSNQFLEELHARENGGTFATVILKNIDTIPLVLPNDILEQQAIALVLSDMDKEIEALESNLSKFQSLREGMMQQLLTGKIRLI